MKAILVIDEMPKNCYACPLTQVRDGVNECYITKSNQDTCPLKSMPTKWVAQINGLDREQQIANWNFVEGWNKCLSKIEELEK